MNMHEALCAYTADAKERQKQGATSGIPEEIEITLSEALTVLSEKSDASEGLEVLNIKDKISDPTLTEIARICVRFGDIFAPVREFLLSTSGYRWADITTPLSNLDEVDRKKSMLGIALWTCDKFPWPCDKNNKPLSPLMQLNLAQHREQLKNKADFPEMIVQVWGDQITPFVRTIALSDIDHSSPEALSKAWENEHLFYGVSVDASGSNRDCNDQKTKFHFGEFIEFSSPMEFSVCRDVAGRAISHVGFKIEELSEEKEFSKKVDKAIMSELIDYIYEISERFEGEFEGSSDNSGYLFGDTKLRQTSYFDWFYDQDCWHGGGWKLLYSPKNKGETLPGLSILWDGEMALFWRIKDGLFEFRAEADR